MRVDGDVERRRAAVVGRVRARVAREELADKPHVAHAARVVERCVARSVGALHVAARRDERAHDVDALGAQRRRVRERGAAAAVARVHDAYRRARAAQAARHVRVVCERDRRREQRDLRWSTRRRGVSGLGVLATKRQVTIVEVAETTRRLKVGSRKLDE